MNATHCIPYDPKCSVCNPARATPLPAKEETPTVKQGTIGRMAPHPLGATLGPAAIGPRRKEPLLVAEIIRLLESHGVPWEQAVREAAGLMAQTVEEAEGWWAFEMAHEESPSDAEMIAQKRAESALSSFSSASEITEAIGTMLLAHEEVVANAKGCDTRPGSGSRLRAARSRLESIYREQQQKIEWARKALEATNIGGIYDAFTDIPDAIQQMGLWIKEQDAELASLKEEQLTAEDARVLLIILPPGEAPPAKRILAKLRALSTKGTVEK